MSAPGNRWASRTTAWMAAESKKVTARRSSVSCLAGSRSAVWNMVSAVAMSTSPVTWTRTWSPSTCAVTEKTGAAPP